MYQQRRSSGVSAPQQAPTPTPALEGADQLGNEAAKSLMLGLGEEADEELELETEVEAPELEGAGDDGPPEPPPPTDAAPPPEDPAAPAAPAPPGAPDAPDQPALKPTVLPHRALLEKQLGTNIDVDVFVGSDALMAAADATAFAAGDAIVLDDPGAPLEVVAEEVTHTLQAEGTPSGDTEEGTSSPSDASEEEATDVASMVADGRMIDADFDIVAAAESGVMRNTGGPAKPPPPPLTEAEKKAIAPAIDPIAEGIHKEITSYWCRDANVIGTLKNLEVVCAQKIYPNGGTLNPAQKNDVRAMLKSRYKALYGVSLSEALGRGMSGEELAAAGALIAEAVIAVPKPPDPAAAPPAAKAPAVPAAPGPAPANKAPANPVPAPPKVEGLTDTEKATVDLYCRGIGRKLNAELTSITYVSDDTVLGLVQSFVGEVDRTIDLSKPSADSRKKKRVESFTMFRTVYKDVYGTELLPHIAKGVDAPVLKQINALLMTSEPAPPAPAKAPVAPAAQKVPPNNTPRDLTAAEIVALRALVLPYVNELYNEFHAFWTSNDVILDIATRAWAAVDDYLRDNADASGRGKTRQGMSILGEQYAKRDGDIGTQVTNHCSKEYHRRIQDKLNLGALAAPPAPVPAAPAQSGATPAVYTNQLTSMDLAVLGPPINTWNKRLSNGFSGYTSDDTILGILEEAHRTIKELVAPTSDPAKNIKAWQEKTEAGMVLLKDRYDATFGGLVTEIKDDVWDEGKRRQCLELIGDRTSAAKKQVATVAAEDTKKNEAGQLAPGAAGPVPNPASKDPLADARVAVMDDLTTEMQGLVDKMAKELGSTWVRDANVVAFSSQFVTLKKKYQGKPELKDRFAEIEYTQMLERLYTASRGDLRADITAGLTQPELDLVFRNLGLGSAAAAAQRDAALDTKMAAAGGDQKQVDALAVDAEVSAICQQMFSELNDMKDDWETGSNVQAVSELLDKAIGIAKKADPDWQKAKTIVYANYKKVAAIDFEKHVAIAVNGRADTAMQVQSMLHITVPVKTEVEGQARDKADLSAIKVDPEKVSVTNDKDGKAKVFDVAMAKDIAVKLYGAIEAKKQAQVVAILTHDRNPAELEVVREVFEAMYGVSVDFKLKEAFNGDNWDPSFGASLGNNPDAVKSLQGMAQTAGKVDFVKEIEQLVDAGNKDAVFDKAMKASAADQQALVDDAVVMGKIRNKLGAPAYERIQKTCTGKLTVSDIVDTRDKSTSWYTLGIGTDEAGLNKDLKAYVEKIKSEIEDEVKTELGPKKPADPKDEKAMAAWKKEVALLVSQRLKLKIAKVSNDPNTQAALASELSSDELLEAILTIDSMGELSATDKVRVDISGLGTGSKLFDNLKAMKEAEKKAYLENEVLMDQLKDDLSKADWERAWSILNGKDYEADVRESIAGFDVDEWKTFSTLADLDASKMREVAANVALQIEIKRRLDKSEIALFEKMIADFQTLGDKDAEAPKDKAKLGSGEDPRVAEKKQQLVIKYKFKLLAAIPEGRDVVLGVAQEVFKEKGEFTPDEDDDQKKIELFGIKERSEVYTETDDAIRAEYADPNVLSRTLSVADAKFPDVIRDAVLGLEDPSGYRLEKGLAGKDNDKAIDGAIDNASDETVIRDWSNIAKPGRTNPSSMKDVYLAYKAVKGKPEEALQKKAFVNFRLDCSSDLEHILQDSWGKYDITATGDKRLLELVDKVRTRLTKMTKEVMLKALCGVVAVDKADEDLFINPDRVARTEYDQHKDQYHQQLDQGSALNPFTSTDAQVMTASALYSGDFAAATDDGNISEDEKAGLDTRKSDFDASVTAYKEAKKAAADIAKAIAAAIITVVATILTGPGGPALLAAMLTASANALAAAAIDEAFLGKDFEFAQEAVKGVATAVATEALTFGMGKLVEGALASGGMLEKVGELAKKIDNFRSGLKDAAKGGGMDFFQHVMLESAIAAGGKGGDGLKGAFVDSMDLSVFKYGWNQGSTNLNANMGAAVNKMPKEMLQAFAEKALTMTAQKVVESKPEDKPKPVDGSEGATGAANGQTGNALTDATAKAPEGPSIGGALKEGLLGSDGAFGNDGKSVLGNNATKALYDQVSGKVSGTLAEMFAQAGAAAIKSGEMDANTLLFRASSWSEADVQDFVNTWVKGRVDATVSGATKDYQDKKNAQSAFEKLSDPATKAQLDAIAAGLASQDEKDAVYAHYVFYMTKQAKRDVNGDFGVSPDDWKKEVWDPLQVQINKKIDGIATDSNAYRKWVLSDPEKAQTRVYTPIGEFSKSMGDSQKTIDAIKGGQGYGQLSGDKKAFYDAYLANPTRFMSVGVESNSGPMDINSADGKSSFDAGYLKTKQDIVLGYVGSSTTLSADQKKVLTDKVAAATDGTTFPSLTPDGANNAAAVEAWAAREAPPVPPPATPAATPAAPPTVAPTP